MQNGTMIARAILLSSVVYAGCATEVSDGASDMDVESSAQAVTTTACGAGKALYSREGFGAGCSAPLTGGSVTCEKGWGRTATLWTISEYTCDYGAYVGIPSSNAVTPAVTNANGTLTPGHAILSDPNCKINKVIRSIGLNTEKRAREFNTQTECETSFNPSALCAAAEQAGVTVCDDTKYLKDWK